MPGVLDERRRRKRRSPYNLFLDEPEQDSVTMRDAVLFVMAALAASIVSWGTWLVLSLIK